MGVPPNHPFAVYRWTCSIKKKNIKNNIKKNKNSYWGTTVYGNAHSKHDDMSGGFKDFFYIFNCRNRMMIPTLFLKMG